ncbi:MAG: hypothetical protein ACRCYR_15435, partial [Phycicoccus sp.]
MSVDAARATVRPAAVRSTVVRTSPSGSLPAEIQLQPPPQLPRPAPGGFMQNGGPMLFMIPMMLGMGAMSFSSMASRGGPMLVVFGVLFGLVMVGMVAFAVLGRSAMRRAAINVERDDYLRWLDQTREQVQEVVDHQRRSLQRLHPRPAALPRLVHGARRWERTRRDPAFLTVRIGVGPQRLACALRMPDTAPLDTLDPVSAVALRRFLRAHSVLEDLPVSLSLNAFPRIAVHGDRVHALALVRAMIAQLVTFHAPSDVRLAFCLSPHALPVWEWAKWLPHALHPTDADEQGPVRQVATDLPALTELLGDQLGPRLRFGGAGQPPVEGPHLVVVVDGGAGGQCPLDE